MVRERFSLQGPLVEQVRFQPFMIGYKGDLAAHDFVGTPAEDARCRGEIQSLRSFQQISKAQSPPMFRHPNFRPVVFKKQRAARTQTGFDSTPVESAIALIDKVRPLPFKLSACSAGKEHSVTQVESGTSQTERIRGDQLSRYFRFINARHTIIAYY